MMRAELAAAFQAAGAVAWGGMAYEKLLPHMGAENRAKAEALVPNPTAALVVAFPYFAGKEPGNLSLYARGRDYHGVLRGRLDTVCDVLRQEYPEYLFLSGADSSPLPEREAAWLSGLGRRGENGLFLLSPYGTYLFLGTILTDAPIPLEEQAPAGPCMGCRRCIQACPTGALEGKGICLSELTQKKGALTAEEAALLKAHPYVWGCDICQTVCPYNNRGTLSTLPEFTEDRIYSLTSAMLEGLTNRAFKETFGHRAFAWRGMAVLRRNLALKNE